MTTKFRTESVNKLLGGGVSTVIVVALNLAAMYALYSLNSGGFDKYFGFIFLKIIAVPIGAWLGWYTQSFTNFVQGQGHQGGKSDDEEQVRSRKAGIIFGLIVAICLLYPYKALWPYIVLAALGVITVVAAIVLWKFWTKYFPDTKM